MDDDLDQGWLRSDGAGFFPGDIGQLLTKVNAFPVTRWNFLVLQPSPDTGAEDRPFLDALCGRLRRELTEGFQFQCQLTSAADPTVVTAWARDLPLRQTMPAPAEVTAALNTTLAKATLPLDPALRAVLRQDPFGSYQGLLERLEAQKPLALRVQNDFLVEETSGYTLIPMLLDHDPLDTAPAAQVEALAAEECAKAGVCERLGYVGGHFASLENKRQVMDDLSAISGTGLACLLTTFALLLALRKLRLLYLLLPILTGMALAAAVVILKDGWIHGLTLSFGSGLVGLSVDYGIHAAFHTGSRSPWRSNLMGLATTVAVLAVMSFSQIPLLRQLMTFSILGLFFSFVALFLLHRLVPEWLRVAPLRVPQRRPRTLVWALAALAVLGLIGPLVTPIDLSMRRLGYLRPKTEELVRWFGQTTKMTNLFLPHDRRGAAGLLDELHGERDWAEREGIHLESPAVYLPTVAVQKANRSTWLTPDCRLRFEADLNDTQRLFFAPYLGSPDEQPCTRVQVQDLTGEGSPAYLRHLLSWDGALTVFFPKTAAQARAVRARFPEAFSLVEVAERFPAVFKSELTWMAPLTLTLIAAVLLAYYRNFWLALVALLPFFCGVGLVVGLALVTGRPLDFVSLIALLMLCGLGLDNGIFAVDGCREATRDPDRTQSALLFCCLGSVLGVLPLAFATHPVLVSLGVPLSVGLVGALLGGMVLVPALLECLPLEETSRG